MAKRGNRQVNKVLTTVVTAFLSVAAVCLLALVTYIIVLGIADRVEAKANAAAAEDEYKVVGDDAGVGRDAVQVFAQKGTLPNEDSEPDIADSSGFTVNDSESSDVMEVAAGSLPVISQDIEIYSVSALMVERSTGQVIFSHDSERGQYPASLVKIMTAVLGLELQDDLNKTVTMSEKMYEGVAESQASTAGFEVGEEVRYIDLLYGLLLPSGAEAANAIALTCCKSLDDFIELMNAKAAELGMTDTNYTNVTGLHDVTMRTTAKDILKLFNYALDNQTFKSIIGNTFYTTAPTNKHSSGITFYSTMYNMLTVTEFENGAVIKGGKTGTTTPAGQCLASYCQIGEREYVLVTLGAYGYSEKDHYNALDAMTLYSLIRTF